MPNPPQSVIYTEPDLDMELLVFQKGFAPGRATLRTLRSYSANVEAGLDDRLRTEISARQAADNAEAAARVYADMQEGQARIAADNQAKSDRQSADAAEAATRANADTVLSQRAAYLEAAAIADERAIVALQQADVAEAKSRSDADAAEAKTRGDADAAEAKARSDADTALGTRLTTVESKLPRTAILTYGNADLTWTYATPFAAGVVPIIEAVVVGRSTDTALFNVQLVGDPTNTAAKFRVNSIPTATVALGGLLNLTLFQQAPSGVKLHVTARIPQ